MLFGLLGELFFGVCDLSLQFFAFDLPAFGLREVVGAFGFPLFGELSGVGNGILRSFDMSGCCCLLDLDAPVLDGFFPSFALGDELLLGGGDFAL